MIAQVRWASPGRLTAVAVVVGAVWAASASPLALLLVSPLVLGVPHVLGDLRFLALHPIYPVSRGFLWAATAPFLAMVGVRLVSLAGLGAYPRFEMVFAALACGAACVAVRGSGRWLGLLVVACASVPALVWPAWTALWIGHLHNLLALGVFCLIAAGRGQVAWAGGVMALAAAGAIAVVAAPIPAAEASLGGLSWGGLLDTLAPGILDPWASRLVALYAYFQALHYAVWILLIPLVVDGLGPRAWLRDLGPGVVAVGVAGAILLPVLGAFSPAAARHAYLSLALFHGWLEIAVLAHWLAAWASQAVDRSSSPDGGSQRASV